MTPPDYDGGGASDRDMRELYPVIEWRVAAWREEAFGVRDRTDKTNAAIDRWLGDRYLNGHGDNPYFPDASLPPGRDRSWKRGTWADVPVSWRDRATELWIECRAAEERRRRSRA